MRILYFLNTLVRGGVEEHVLTLANGLDRRRFEVSLACPGCLLELLKPDLAADVAVHDIDIQRWSDLRSIRHLASIVRKSAPDVLHSHLFYASMFGSTIGKLAGVPTTIETYHVPEVWRTGWLKKSGLIDRGFAGFVDHFIAVSHAVGAHLERVKKVPAQKITVIWNGRDLSAYTGVGRGGFSIPDAGSKAVVGVVGRLEPQKGHAHLIRAMPAIVRQFPDVLFAFLGDGRLRAALEEQCRSAGIADAVRFLGYDKDVAGFLNSIDIFVLPSLYEGLPLAVIEASAAGLPIVATAVDGTPEVVVDGETGLLVPAGDPDALVGPILSLLKDPARGERLGRAAARRARENFGLSSQIRATEEIYARLGRKGVRAEASCHAGA